MVDTERPGGHHDCDGHDDAGMRPRLNISFSTGLPSFQLRRTRGNEGSFSRFVLVRVVRLTIETNTITGTYPSKTV
jgi:hypothetical protein